MNDAERRVWARLPEGAREAMDALPATDLQTLLLSVARTRSGRVRPVDLLRRWREDRFVRPADSDPRTLAALEDRLWRLLPTEVQGVELSPVVPMGTCAAVGPVSQNRIVTTMRSAEVVSDSTNALAIEAATRRLRQPTTGVVHLAASHRQLRAQQFGPGMGAHFRLFALVSSARDVGSGATQAQLLLLHLGYWQEVLAALLPPGSARLHYTLLADPAVRERIADTVLPALATGPVPVVAEPDRERGRGYYTAVALRITAGPVELGDGGFTTWTSQLMGNAKERCLVSCLSTERLAAVRLAAAGDVPKSIMRLDVHDRRDHDDRPMIAAGKGVSAGRAGWGAGGAFDQFGGQPDVGVAFDAVDEVDQQHQRLGAHPLQRLVDRGQRRRGERGLGHVVEADDRQVVGHGQAQPAGDLHGGDRGEVVGREHGGRAVRVGEQFAGRAPRRSRACSRRPGPGDSSTVTPASASAWRKPASRRRADSRSGRPPRKPIRRWPRPSR